MSLKKKIFRKIRDVLERRLATTMTLYPPYLGAGVCVEHLADDGTSCRVCLKMRPWNKNYVGVHFGGSLYSMCDPFFMLMMMRQLGPGYIVWDKAASIRFRRPGRGDVYATFELSAEEVARVRDEVAQHGRCEPRYVAQVLDASGELVAEVEKILSVKLARS
jgi:acyl-coenzyme A thioesterase PaaI-like protein